MIVTQLAYKTDKEANRGKALDRQTSWLYVLRLDWFPHMHSKFVEIPQDPKNTLDHDDLRKTLHYTSLSSNAEWLLSCMMEDTRETP